MIVRILLLLVILVALAAAGLHYAGSGALTEDWTAGEPSAAATPASVTAARQASQTRAARTAGVAGPKQILFGDLHVHTTFSFDAFQQSLPMAGGDGARPVADACDYARHCSALDFWSINDHAITLTPRRWNETVRGIRECNALTDPANPDLVSYLGWEWTQVGTTPETHWGHKNVVLRDLEDGSIPTHPVSAGTPPGMGEVANVVPSQVELGALAVLERDGGGADFVRYMNETTSLQDCDPGTGVGELPEQCRDVAPTPRDLFARLDEWALESMVIPHGTTWGFYTPPGSSWDKQLNAEQHDPDRQGLMEIFSGHGNSEEFRPFRSVDFAAGGARSCPAPTKGFLPSCWRAGEIVEGRCLAEGLEAEECAERAATARQNWVDADFNGGFRTLTGTEVADWQDGGQCTDCFQPSFNYRPRSSVQYVMALGRKDAQGDPLRFDFGFIAASDNHSARPGTGYKEVARTSFTEQRFGNFVDTPTGAAEQLPPTASSRPFEYEVGSSPFSTFETERAASFFLTGGLAAVHADGRDRESIWDAMQRKEVYGTSGPRILLWFDLLNAPGGQPAPMGSKHVLGAPPVFQVRAVGSLEQEPGCPTGAEQALGPEQIERLCRGECYHPSDTRRPITRIEVVRIRPQESAGEDVEALIEDPWQILPCSGDPAGCQVAFFDSEFISGGRDALYYVRAIEAPSPAVAADPLGCERDAAGRCVSIDPCFGRPDSDECLSSTEERAWSSPIFLSQPRS